MNRTEGAWRRASVATPAGVLLAVTRDGELAVLCFPDAVPQAEAMLRRTFRVSLDDMADAPMPALAFALDAYFIAGDESSLRTLPRLAAGTAFQRAVWAELARIPRGATRTYGEIAVALGKGAGSARAVGQAVGANLLNLVVPCHRAVAAGGLGGFNGGLATKEALLALEQR